MSQAMREFASGATRSSSDNKPDYEGFLSPIVLRAFGEYMHKHRHQTDGKLRASDNWQKGIPDAELLKSMLRHTVDVWRMHRMKVRFLADEEEPKNYRDQLIAIIFGAQALLYNDLVGKGDNDPTGVVPNRKSEEPKHPTSLRNPSWGGGVGL